MVDPTKFVSPDGTSIKWQMLVGTVLGSIVFAVIDSIVAVLLLTSDIVLGLLNGAAEFTSRLVELRVGTFVGMMQAAWDQTIGFIESFGILGYAAAIGIVLVTLWIVAQGVSRVP